LRIVSVKLNIFLGGTMKDIYIKHEKYTNITQRIFEKLGYEIIDEYKNNKHDYDLIVQNNNNEYYIEVKVKYYYESMLQQIRKNKENKNKNNIVIVYDIIDSKIKKELEKNKETIIIDLSNILYLIDADDDIRSEVLEIIDISTSKIELIKPRIPFRPIKKSNERIVADYVNQLNILASGRGDSSKYEKTCVSIIEYLFKEDVTLGEPQFGTDEGLFRFDMICKIKRNISEDNFFYMIENFFATKYVIFEFKNYENKIKQGEIFTTEKYLYATALRKVAIIFAREGVDENGQKAIRGILRESGKLILVVNNKELKTMLELKNSNNEKKPLDILTDKLDELLMKLDK
jgi:hypothetical protein